MGYVELGAAAIVLSIAMGTPVAAADTAGLADEIVVTASPIFSTPDDLATQVTVIGRDEILNKGASTLGALLADEPGIAQSSFAAGASRPIIRGLDNFRVHILENGLGGDGVSAVSEDHGVPIDPMSAEKVEVVRGPATLRYGSEAIGGVVNVINSRIPTFIPEGGYTGEVSGSYDTVDDGRQGSAMVEASTGRVVWHADAYDRIADDYRIPGGTSRQSETWADSKGVAGGASVLFDSGYVGASISHFDSDYGIPVPDDLSDPTFINMEQTKVQTAAEFNDLGSWAKTLRVTGGYTKYNHGEVGMNSGDVGSRFDDTLWEGRAELLHGNVGPFTGAIGIHAIDHDLSAGGEGGDLLAPTTTKTLAAFVFEEMPLTGVLKFQLGGRIEHVAIEGSAFDETTFVDHLTDKSFVPLSGSSGLVWQLGNGWVAGGTLQASQRAPEALELFSKGAHDATGTFEIGDVGLTKETAYSGELSLRREGENFSFQAAVYETKFDNYILKQYTGETCGEDFASCTPGGSGGDFRQVRYSQQDATFRGFEIGGKHSVAKLDDGTIGLDGRFDMVRATLDAGGNVPRIPPMRVGAGVYYEANQWSGRIGALYAFSQTDLGAFETETGGYTLLNAELHYLLPKEITHATPVELSLIGDNLLNDDIRNSVSFKKDGMLLPGRDVRFVATARF